MAYVSPMSSIFETDSSTGNSYQSPMASIFDPDEDEEERKLKAAELKRLAKEEAEKKKESEKGALKKASKVAKAAGGFVKDVAVDIYDTTKDTAVGLTDVVQGEISGNKLEKNTQELNEFTKKRSAYLKTLSEDDFDKPDVKKKLKELETESQKIQGKITDKDKENLENLQDIDAKELAFDSAETALNVGTLGIGTAGKAGAKQGAKITIKEIAKQSIKKGNTEMLDRVIAQGGVKAARAAAKELAENGGKEAAESLMKKVLKTGGKDALIGTGYGITQTGKNDPDAAATEFVRNAVIGAGFGAGTGALSEVGGQLFKHYKGKGIKEKAAKKMAKETQELAHLTPEEYSAKMGVPITEATQELDRIKTAGPEEIVEKGVKAKLNKVFSPVSNFGERTQQSFQKSAGGRNLAKSQRRTVVRDLKEAAQEAGQELDWDLVLKIEDGSAPKNAFTTKFREILDQSRQEAVDAGLDIGEVTDYVPHIWKESADSVEKIAKGAGIKPRGANKRIIPTYEEGIALGFKPKYKNPADIVGDYVENMQNARTNMAFLTDMKQQGMISAGRPKSGWKTITAEGFPRTAEGNQLTAPKQVADTINSIYGSNDTIADKLVRSTAKINSTWQDITLSGGVPHTPMNFFTFAQMMKEGALSIGQGLTNPKKGAKTAYGAVDSFVRGFSQNKTDKLFKRNEWLVNQMEKRNVPFSVAESNLGKNATEQAADIFKWGKLFNEPTFGRFMPNLQLNTAKNTYTSLSKKMGKEEALDVTAEIMQKYMGITDQMATGRSQFVQDSIGTIAFAPKYRESIVNVLGNTVRSLNPKNFNDKSYSLNRRLATGMGVTYMIYDLINQQTTGHSMGDNPKGKELNLAIPYGEPDENGERKVAYLPFMPSFMTIPRAGFNAVKSLSEGDVDSAVGESGKLLSMPIKTIADLISNEDYFGRPIVMDEDAARAENELEDSSFDKFKKRANYVIGQGLPAYGRAAQGYLEGDAPEEIAAQIGEAPIRFGKLDAQSSEEGSFSPGEVKSEWFDAYNPARVKRNKASQEVTRLVKLGKKNEAKRKAEEFNESINDMFSDYYGKYEQDPDDNPMWEEMLEGLVIKTSDRGFSFRESL